jgi:hypothetical protein
VASPGNLIEKENINSFIYTIYGVEENQTPLSIELYPAIYPELIDNYNQIFNYFFKGIELKEHN